VPKRPKKLEGHPTFDARGNAIWKFAGQSGVELKTESVKALAEGLSLEGPSETVSPDPYNQALAQDEEKPKGRSLDDMRRLNERMKREHEELVRKLRHGAPEAQARSAGPVRGVRLRLRIGDRELLVDEHRSSVLIGRGEDNDIVLQGELVSRLHVCVEVIGNKLVLTDVSANGTFVQSADGRVSRTRRNSFQLNGQGMIGVGRRPKHGSSYTIHFSCEEL
jgi:hypothetical protein